MTIPPTKTPADPKAAPLPPDLAALDAWWRAANFLGVAQIYLLANPLLQQPLDAMQVKPRLLGHWGTTPGLNFLYAHLNRVIRRDDARVLFVAGPGHGGPALAACHFLDGAWGEVDPSFTQDLAGALRLVRQFSFPGGIGSHVTPEVPGSIHEGGELGYALSHAYGAAFDDPDLVVACVVGDGEAETGPLAASWHSNKFLNPARDGAVLPILHLNGYKIANPTLLARMPRAELVKLLEGYGHEVLVVSGHEPAAMHRAMAQALDRAFSLIREIQSRARAATGSGTGAPTAGATRSSANPPATPARPRWPMIVFESPKGWTGPVTVDGFPAEGNWRSHQVPFSDLAANPDRLAELERWLRSYRPEELFDADGRPVAALRAMAPRRERLMGLCSAGNGGVKLEELPLPDWRSLAVPVTAPGTGLASATATIGLMLREILRTDVGRRAFLLFGPDETASNRLGAVFEVTSRRWLDAPRDGDPALAPDGRVLEILSEHCCQGWLEGYLLSGRHGFFSCYEAFIHIVDSMFNQHAKWLKVAAQVPWRKPVASLNILLTSHVWRQDHNGFSHQDPGFIDHVVNKKSDIVRVYLPPDSNTALWVADHCLRSRNRINVIVAGKNVTAQWLDAEAADMHCRSGIGRWAWASTDAGGEPDVVLAAAGDVPTIEVLAAIMLLREDMPFLRMRMINVVDLMTLQSASEHPHGLDDARFDALFTQNRPVLFAHHGYPWLIHRLTYRRRNHANLHVRGYKEEGTTTTPFDMAVLNDLDRFRLVMDVIDRVPGLATRGAALRARMVAKRAEHAAYIRERGEDLPEIREWQWQGRTG